MTLPELTFSTRTSADCIIYESLVPNRATNVQTIDRSSFTPLNKYEFRCADFHEAHHKSIYVYDHLLY
jgi:hypothetical protein